VSTNPAVTVLIADDSQVIRAVVRDQLEGEGYLVHEAEDGIEALSACAAIRPDAVLLDIEMPGLDGRQVLERLKADPELRDIPVVFLTGRIGTDDVVACLRAGAHDYLKKPFEPAELIARISSALHIKELQDELRRRNAELDRIARVDPVTQLFNRRHLQEQLEDMCAAARRSNASVAVILFDIDHFKRVNDVHGHASGDLVLLECARRLNDEARAGTVVGRWGGEEFLVLLPDADVEDASRAAERMRARIADAPVIVDGTSLTMTISAGCAASRSGAHHALVAAADAALYQSKAAGRNRVTMAPLDPSSGTVGRTSS
jgi:two-component system cell cycle response regulator